MRSRSLVRRQLSSSFPLQQNPEFVSEAYDDVEAIWQQLLEAAGIDRFATFSGGSSGITFMEFADEQPG